MNKEFIKRLTNAHGWIGLTFSGLLFIIFFAGSIALFRQEVYLWSIQPHLPVNTGEQASVEEILESALEGRDYDAKEHITLLFPSDISYYYKAYVDIKDKKGEEHFDTLLIDPISAEVVHEGNEFELGEFLYELHYNLNIPAGEYVLGFVTLFFLFALVSGIFIHSKKLISNFFQYRGEKHKRSQLLDTHSVIGVITLPFTLMYAISGLIFNLVIIYQIAFAVIIYGGDQQALLDDAGFKRVAPQWTSTPTPRVNIDELIAEVTADYQGLTPRFLTIYNYGDKSSLIQFRSENTSELTTNYNSIYSLVDKQVFMQSDPEHSNTLIVGTDVLTKLHYGNYASINLRIVYLLLALGVCGLIITGNFLWIEKREKQRGHGTRSLAVARYITMVSSAGVIFSTSVAFLCERLMPFAWTNRPEVLSQTFWLSLVLAAIVFALPKAKANYRKALAISLYVCAGIISVTLIMSFVLFSQTLTELLNTGHYTVLSVDIALLIVTFAFVSVGRMLMKKANKKIADEDVLNTAVA